MKEKKIAFIGGDARQMAAALRVRELGYSVSVFGIPGEVRDGVESLGSFADAYTADVLVLPLPMSGDGITVSCAGDSPRLAEIFENAGGIPILGGRVSPRAADEASRLGVRLYDYFDSEELKIKNAYLTAEGAVSLAMNELDIALAGSRTAVVGYGRIGKFLARMLVSLDSDVTVAARKPTDLAYAAGFGLDTLKITARDGRSSLCDLADCHVIFNTAPHWVFDGSVLSELSSDTLIIDLASAPGGVDPEAAKKYGIRVISALGLPGKYAPMTAGRFVGEAIAELIPKIT